MASNAIPGRWRRAAALALLPLLAGCLPAVAIPLVAGGALYMRDKAIKVRAATPTRPEEQRLVTPDGIDATLPVAGPAPGPVVTGLAELPVPTSRVLPGAGDPWQSFFGYALAQAATMREAKAPQSALLAPDALLTRAQRRPCLARHPAVILDLDQARTPFAPAADFHPAAGLAEGLASLREQGVVILWLTELPAAQVGSVAGALRSSGLDPDGTDQFLLIRGPADRKQVLREHASEDVCVVAIAGDRRADFDELFDYLRDPETAVGLDEMLGSGWFIVPRPLASPAP